MGYLLHVRPCNRSWGKSGKQDKLSLKKETCSSLGTCPLSQFPSLWQKMSQPLQCLKHNLGGGREGVILDLSPSSPTSPSSSLMARLTDSTSKCSIQSTYFFPFSQMHLGQGTIFLPGLAHRITSPTVLCAATLTLPQPILHMAATKSFEKKKSMSHVTTPLVPTVLGTKPKLLNKASRSLPPHGLPLSASPSEGQHIWPLLLIGSEHSSLGCHLPNKTVRSVRTGCAITVY